jgi:hypothetical protein
MFSVSCLLPRLEKINAIHDNVTKYVRAKVSTAVTTKNAVFWDTKAQFYLIGKVFILPYTFQPVNAL